MKRPVSDVGLAASVPRGPRDVGLAERRRVGTDLVGGTKTVSNCI